jgi:PTH1 family peptidyl-tRNA hydrolase
VLREQWRLPKFRRLGRAQLTEGSVAGESILLVKPQTYMNRSGEAVRDLLASTALDPASDLLVLVDDSALPLGTFRLRSKGSAGGHNGLISVEQAIGAITYARLRIGIGPVPEDIDDQADFVTAPFAPDELAQLADLLPTLVDAVECWLVEGTDAAMNQFNKKLED